MKIVKPYATLLQRNNETALQFIEWAGRISHRSEDQQGDLEKTKTFLTNVVLRHGDWSIVEHFSCSVDLLVDRGITHELVRHRLASYTQESTRFVNYEKKMPPSFIYPKPEVECSLCLAGNEVCRYDTSLSFFHSAPTEGNPFDWVSCAYEERWFDAVDTAELSYRQLLKEGWRPQEARSVFPNALASRIVMTCNLRQWRHFFIMRTTKEAHPQMRQVSIPLLADFKQQFPVLFDDIQPNSRQVENLGLPR